MSKLCLVALKINHLCVGHPESGFIANKHQKQYRNSLNSFTEQGVVAVHPWSQRASVLGLPLCWDV